MSQLTTSKDKLLKFYDWAETIPSHRDKEPVLYELEKCIAELQILRNELIIEICYNAASRMCDD